MRLRSVKEAPLHKGARVLVRVDFNVPMTGARVADDFRIRETLPTLHYLLEKGVSLVIVSHLGRPSRGPDSTLSLLPVFHHSRRLIRGCRRFSFVADPFAAKGEREIRSLGPREIVMVENIRFWKGEKGNSRVFAKKLASFADLFVNDAFGDSHREHASIVGVSKFLPSYAGPLLQKEVRALERATKNPKRPFIAIIGGAKVSEKADIIKRFIHDADHILLGGALANSLLAAEGIRVGHSRVERVDFWGSAPFRITNTKVHIPIDAIIAKSLHPRKSEMRIRGIGSTRRDEYVLDVGPDTVELFSNVVDVARTIIWNGPMGFAEYKKFAGGTLGLAKALRRSKAFRVVGGGDTIAVLEKNHLLKGFDHISTGGGAMLEFLAGKKLPGVEVVRKK